MIVLAVSWLANPGKEAEVAAVFRKLQDASRQEPGCLMYLGHQHQADPCRFFIYEQYRDHAALEAHRQSQHFQDYVMKALQGISERREAELYSPLSEDDSSV
jgi:quinol monooxygenase YgiN